MRFAKKNLASLVAISLLGLSAAAFAADPVPVPSSDTANVTITATVVDNTCVVDTTSTTWNFPSSVKLDDIMRDGPTANKEVKIMLTDCGPSASKVTVSSNDAKMNASGMITNQADNSSAAKNVAAEILSNDNSTVLTPTSSLTYPLTPNGKSELDFNVKLKQSDGNPKAGDFNTSVALNLAYE